MISTSARAVLQEIAAKGASRKFSRRSKYAHIARALCDLRLVRRYSTGPLDASGGYILTDAGFAELRA